MQNSAGLILKTLLLEKCPISVFKTVLQLESH